MLAQNGFAYSAQLARQIANLGYCPAKKTYFHGVRLHVIAESRFERLPTYLKSGSAKPPHTTSAAAKEQRLELPNTTLIADLAYPEPDFRLTLNRQNTNLYAGRKNRKVRT